MRVVQVQDNFGIDNIKIVERDVPKPGPGEVLVKMKAVSLNYRDLMSVTNGGTMNLKLPYIPLSDGAGEVVETGAGVTTVKKGDRVCTTFFHAWDAGDLRGNVYATARGGAHVPGIFQEYVCTRELGVIPAPAHLDDVEAATLPCAALTAWRAFFVEAALKPGDSVLIEGTGGVSIFALQFAKLCGAEVILTSSSDEKLARAKKLGADHLLNYKHEPKWGRKARELTGGRGVDQVIEVGGSNTLPQALQAIKTGGYVCVIGVLSQGNFDLPGFSIIGTNVRIQGITVGSRAHFEDMNRALALHKIKPVVDKVFTLDATKEAFGTMQAATHFGKIAIRLGA